ncbi:MAG TPA: ABC transporter permease subunit [Actinobacteria bacterium]|nr:ABC transporter permease subunit [Actinomycetota bacterium]
MGERIRARLPRNSTRILDLVLAAAAGALFAILVARMLGWLYRITDPMAITWWPLIAGALIGLGLAARAVRRETVGIGLSVYFIARTVFNTIRSIEPLVMVLVFVVWVGLGPFAGSLALALHTVAALAKLYSEQVESISAGPIEAVRATGANRVQTIVYAVIPQIVPPYISFTMYRWDINVRMSTIIGFAGGGGIGLILQQNIRLLDYRAASVNMLAIAIVVATMDYISSRIRENVV